MLMNPRRPGTSNQRCSVSDFMRSDMRPHAGEPNGFLVVRADVFPHLVMPVGPFVPALRAPVVQMMGNAAVRQDPDI